SSHAPRSHPAAPSFPPRRSSDLVEVPLTAPERRRFGILILITDEILANGIHNGLHNRIASFSGHEQGLAPISHCMRTAVGFLLFFRIDKLKAHGMNIVHSVAPFDPFRS